VVAEQTQEGKKASYEGREEERLYANFISFGSMVAIGLLIFGYVFYVGGILSPAVPITSLPSVWGLDVREYVSAIGAPTGWGWLRHLNRGEYFNYLGISLLAGLNIVGYIVLLPGAIRRKETVYTILVAAEIVVLVLAAGNFLPAAP